MGVLLIVLIAFSALALLPAVKLHACGYLPSLTLVIVALAILALMFLGGL